MRTRIVLILALLLLAGCSSAQPGPGGRTRVVAAFYPLAYAAEQIGGPSVSVEDLTPPGVEPHDLELRGSDLRRIADADLVLYLGGGFQPAVEDAVESTGVRAVDLRGGADPHVWLDPVRYAALGKRVGRELGRPQAAARFAARLERLDRDLRAGLTGCARDELVTSHAAFGRLAERYGLRQVALTGIAPEVEPTPRQLERIVDEVRRTGATTVFAERLVSPRLAETVARETGAATAMLDPIESRPPAGDYFTAMRANLAALRKALGCP